MWIMFSRISNAFVKDLFSFCVYRVRTSKGRRSKSLMSMPVDSWKYTLMSLPSNLFEAQKWIICPFPLLLKEWLACLSLLPNSLDLSYSSVAITATTAPSPLISSELSSLYSNLYEAFSFRISLKQCSFPAGISRVSFITSQLADDSMTANIIKYTLIILFMFIIN